VDYFFIGESELLSAFQFAGVGGTAVSNKDEAISAFHKITASSQVAPHLVAGARAEMATRTESGGEAKKTKILILTEQAADWMGDELTEWQLSGAYPLIVELPGLGGKIVGRKSLVDAIREAIGIHV
jgi:V/A-type H+-transporting ATPase subunit F